MAVNKNKIGNNIDLKFPLLPMGVLAPRSAHARNNNESSLATFPIQVSTVIKDINTNLRKLQEETLFLKVLKVKLFLNE